MTAWKYTLLIVLLIAVLTGAFVVATKILGRDQTPTGQKAPAFSGPAGYINTDKITLEELVGRKVILVDFWTYSCINCQRTLPYLNAWYERYRESGLEIIGVHTPEFAFEENYDNVALAVKQYGITYPVILDNEYHAWRAYNNRFWPHKYLIDIHGNIVYDHIGEGAYEEIEEKIRELLDGRFAFLHSPERIAPEMSRPEGTLTVDASKIGSPEIYFGAERNTNLGNGPRHMRGEQRFTLPDDIKANQLYLDGTWDIQDEHAESKSPKAKIIFKYIAKSVYFVASSAEKTRVTILLDGEPIDTAAGLDVSADGTLTIQREATYFLVDDPGGYGTHTLELIIENPGVKAYTLTFG